MAYGGEQRLHEGGIWGVLGDLGELFKSALFLDMFVCQTCGSVEFFVPGFARKRHLQPESPDPDKLTWKCSQCDEINIRSAELCKRCGAGRLTDRATGLRGTGRNRLEACATSG